MTGKFAVAVKCAILDGNSCLVLYKAAKRNRAAAMDLPGGRVEYGEDIKDALRRELNEELGFAPESFSLVDARTVMRPDGTHLVMLHYHAAHTGQPIRLSAEHCRYKWLTAGSGENVPEWISQFMRKVLPHKE